MPLESAAYLHQLDAANPAATDLLAQGDDHIRLIKAVLKATFPNLTGAVTLTQAQLNAVPTAIAGGGVPVGAITAWYGTAGAVPAGWAICNGQTVAKSDASGNITTPDLRDRVVIGAGSVVAQGLTHGAANASVSTTAGGAHTHASSGGAHGHPGAACADTTLTVSQLPAHKHLNGVGDDQTLGFTRGTGPAASATKAMDLDDGGQTSAYEGYTETVGGGQPHNHPITFTGADGTHSHTIDNAPDHQHSVTVPTYQPALALHFIMKV